MILLLSLLKLTYPLQLNYYIWPVLLADKTDIGNTINGKIAVASGWGQTEDGPGNTPNTLKFVDLSIDNTCSGTEPGSSFGGIVCADSEDGNSGICFGDSGGPLVLKEEDRLIGISSYVNDEQCNTPDGFVRVTYYLDWIKTNTGITF